MKQAVVVIEHYYDLRREAGDFDVVAICANADLANDWITVNHKDPDEGTEYWYEITGMVEVHNQFVISPRPRRKANQ